MRNHHIVRLAGFLVLLLPFAPARAASVWVEGEAAAEKTVVKHRWYDAVKKDGMSGGDWLSHYGDKPGTASYTFDAPEAGDYTFWVRANPFNAGLAYKLNGAAPVEIDFAHADKRGEFMVSEKPDHRFLAWVKVGRVPLRQGPNAVAFTIHGNPSNHGGIDCFLFDNAAFVPSGVMKPGAGGASGAAAGGAAKTAGPEQAIWIEGESATDKHVTKHGWYDAVKKDGMSGGNWVSHYDKQSPGTAAYKFDVAKAGEYTFWWRGNVLAAKVAWQLNAGEWREIDFADKRGEFMISERPDHRSLAWVRVGKVALPAGANTVTFKFHSDLANHGGIDCFCFTSIPFTPSGVNKPTAADTESAGGAADWFPVVFDADTFSDKSVIDMSKYIEAPAGTHGFLKRDKADLRFERGTEPVQFWGAGANLQRGKFSREQLTQRAKYLRKHGVNMVRQHTVWEEVGPLVNGQLDPKRLDEWDWWCAELKRQGIYMTWSVFYGHRIGPGDGYDPELFNELEIVDAKAGLRNTYGLVNVEPKLQELQLKYLTALMAHKNPYTGLRPVDDPHVAVLEFQNEDTVFFHMPLSVLRDGKKWPQHSRRLRQRWAAWVKQKYGTEDAVKKAWGGLKPGDNFAAGELGLMAAYHLGANGPLNEYAGQTARAGDFIRFLTEMQKAFYDRREQEIRGLGFKAVTVTTAWRAGGPAADPANLYCDTAADMIDRHNYFGGGVGNHDIKEGAVNNGTHLARPGVGLLSLGMYQVADRPFAVTEWTQMPPNQWKAEAAPLMAFYGMGLQGWDSLYHFTSGRAYPGDGWPNLSSYVTDTPHYIGQWPALFFAVHNRHVKEGPVAAARHLKAEDLFSGVDPLKQDFTGGGHDAKALQGQLVTPSEALAIGKVTVAFDGGQSTAVDWNKYWDRDKQTVTSMTGELMWDYGGQIVTVGTPKTQAIIGRAGGRTVTLPAASVTVETPFVSLLLTPLDNKNLADSGDILITAMARDTQTNARYSDDGKQLLQVGSPPLLMEPVQATLKLSGAAPKTINVLDVYGVPTGKTVKPAADGSFAIDGTYRTYYYQVRR